MPSPPQRLPHQLRLAPFHVSEARDAGVSSARLRARDLTAPFHGVRTTAPPRTLLERCHAYAARMHAEHWFSHATAARLWGLPLPARILRETRLDVSAPGREPHGRGVIGHRASTRPDLGFFDGLPVLAPADAWCQLAGMVDSDELIVAGDRLLGWPDPFVTLDELDAAIARHGSRRGARSLRTARLELRPRSASPRETRLRLLVVRAGYPEPALNHPIPTGGGRVTHGDLAFVAYRVLLEYDGEQHRTDRTRFDKDVDRLNALALAGWLVIRIRAGTPDDAILDALDRALRLRGWHPPAPPTIATPTHPELRSASAGSRSSR